ncbi:ribonuclease toxin immunity protein CdiI [Niallia taxi]
MSTNISFVGFFRGVVELGDSGNRRELIKVFYHVMGDGRFLTILEYISKEIGYGDEYARFVFANNWEEWEEDYFGKEGVCYYIDAPAVGEDVEFVLDYNTFYQYLEEDTAEYLEKYPYYRARVEELLAKIRERFNIQ